MNREEYISKMEKRRNRAILKVLVPVTVLMVVLAIVVGFIAFNSGKLNPVSATKFLEAASNQNCKVYDVLTEIDKKDLFNSAYLAKIDSDEKSAITFFDFKEKNSAKSYFASVARTYKTEASKENINSVSQKELPNYSFYSAECDEKYFYVVRVKDTVVSAQTDIENMNVVKKIIGEIDY